MNVYLAVFVIAAVFSLFGLLWLAMAGFKRSALWGVLVLMLSPLGAVIYAAMNWYDARKPFLVYCVSVLLMAGSAALIASDAGVHNLQQIGAHLHAGKIGPAQAYNLLNKAMAHTGAQDVFAEETAASAVTAAAQPKPGQLAGNPAAASAVAAPESGKKPEVANPAQTGAATGQTKTDDKPSVKPEAVAPVPAAGAADSTKPAAKTGNTDTTADPDQANADKPVQSRIPDPDQVQPDPLAQKKKKEPPKTVSVSMNKLPNYIGHYFIIRLHSGVERRGLLRQVDDTKLVLDRKLYSGKIEYRIYKSEVKSIQMLKNPPEER